MSTVVFRMKDGFEIKVECDNINITTHKLTGNLLGYEIQNMARKGKIPLYMPVDNIAMIYQVKEDSADASTDD